MAVLGVLEVAGGVYGPEAGQPSTPGPLADGYRVEAQAPRRT